ncbi:phosphoesterase [Vibrio rumoiensis 1S-45]|uniref:Phosphoesterase n=1 Tax=Vibrio rumoiensis 1S-45 TaxID=1188252 RepID=A0A1E5E5K2_9VIBR|nr:phosphoesterase [Vibrio rumoiensis 1S-45]
MKSFRAFIPLAISMALFGCNEETKTAENQTEETENSDANEPEPIASSLKVAFMPDIHFHDVYGDFEDGSFDGLPNSKSGDNATIRTMLSQMNSTRLFNENYFALLAALDDVVAKGIKYVALPGDFSDDGQPVHLRGLAKIFKKYEEEHGLVFFAAPGNHDPVRPFNQPGGKSDFLGEGGQNQRIYSLGKNECQGYTEATTTIDNASGLATICTQEIQHLGYESVMSMMGDFGFYPDESYLYYETPYSQNKSVDSYSYTEAKTDATYQNRMYEICYEGTGGDYKQEGYTSCSMVPDSTYLVEPVEGVWLLAIDANVYRPKNNSTGGEDNPDGYDGSSSAGYNLMLTHKQQVIEWIADVVQRAKEQNKVLLSFSHFPMTDFYNGASEDIEDVFGEGNFQLSRMPQNSTSEALAETGLTVHVGGHMHFNDTGVKQYQKEGKTYTLFNIQAPSLAGYVPAYKILSLKPNSQIEVETVIIGDVARFDELFEHYQKEYDYLVSSKSDSLWNKAILNSKSYYELTDWHIRELTRLRFLPSEWPEDMKTMIFNMNGKEMLIMSQIETTLTYCEMSYLLGDSTGCSLTEEQNIQAKIEWDAATVNAQAKAEEAGLTLATFEQWTGTELATDFYRLRNADELAFRDIEEQRLSEYELLSLELSSFKGEIVIDDSTDVNSLNAGELFRSRFGSLFYILDKFASGEASDHFIIDTEYGTLEDLVQSPAREHFAH